MSETHEHGTPEAGMALGFRIFEVTGVMFMAEADIAPADEDPNALSATLVFHPLTDIDPTSETVEDEPPVGALELGEVLTHDHKAPMKEQFQAILRQLSRLGDDELRRYLELARQQTEL